MDDKPVYFDSESNQLYWIEWQETGNNDIPIRHYLNADGCPKNDPLHRLGSCPSCGPGWTWRADKPQPGHSETAVHQKRK